jgi:flagellar biosynthesis/type III secretory pathway chaperone
VEFVSRAKGEYVVQARAALEKMTLSRTRRASKAALEAALSNIGSELKRIRQENEKSGYTFPKHTCIILTSFQ